MKNFKEFSVELDEVSNDYFKRRKDEEDRIAGKKAPAKRKPKQTDYEKKRKEQMKEDIAICSECGQAPCVCDDSHGFVSEAATSVKGWAAQVRKTHGATVKFVNKASGSGIDNRSIARNAKGETVGVYNRNTGNATVHEPKSNIKEAALDEVAQGHTIEAHGIRGMKGTAWKKTFKSHDHLAKWADANDSIEVHATRDLDGVKKKTNEEALSKRMPGNVGDSLGYLNAAERAKELARRKAKIAGNTTPASKAFVNKALKKEEVLDELSTDTLTSYKKKAGESATAADKAGDTTKGHKRFKGIMKATFKQFANDAK